METAIIIGALYMLLPCRPGCGEKIRLSMIGMGDWWFIVMTLTLYLLTWISFRLCSARRP